MKAIPDAHPLPPRRLFASRAHAGLQVAEICYLPHTRQGEHSHSYPTVTLLVAGGIDERAERAAQRASAGNVVLKPAGTEHANVYGPLGARTLQIAWKGSATERAPRWMEAPTAYRWFDGGPMAAAIVRLYRVLEGFEASPELALEESLGQMAAISNPDRSRPGARHRPAWLTRIVERLAAAGCDALRISDLAAEADVHPVYLARVFRRFHRCSMSQFVRRLRVAEVCRRLATSPAPLASLALEAGFADQPHLCRAFRAEMGITPSAYRHLVRSD